MCEPATITAAAAIAGVAMTGYGLYQQGQAQKEVGEYNANLARVKAEDAISTGAIAEERQRARVRQIQGAQRAEMGGSGAVVGAGSFGEMLDQTATFGELDAQTIRANTQKQAWGLETQARADEFMGSAASRAGTYRAAGTLLSAAPDVYRSGKNANWW